MKYNLKISERQAKTLIKALDLYSRIHALQIEEIAVLLRWNLSNHDTSGNEIPFENIHELEDRIRALKTELLNTPGSAHHGIRSPKISDDARTAYDIQQVIRHQLWKDDPERQEYCVDSNEPWRSSEKEELAEIEEKDKYRSELLRFAKEMDDRLGKLSSGNVSHHARNLQQECINAVDWVEEQERN